MTVDRDDPTILVVDDDDDIREMMSYVLEQHRLRVVDAGSGAEALDKAHDTSGLSLVLLDLRMPGMSGADVLETMKRDPELTTVPVVVISGDRDAPATAASLGASGCLIKPVTTKALLREISRFVSVPA